MDLQDTDFMANILATSISSGKPVLEKVDSVMQHFWWRGFPGTAVSRKYFSVQLDWRRHSAFDGQIRIETHHKG